MSGDVEILVRFSHFSGDRGSPFDAYDEVQRVLDKHFKSRFVDSKGATYHVGVILASTGTPKPTPHVPRLRRVRRSA